MMAKEYGVPVVVCCETYKFSETVMLDGFGKNELGMSNSFLGISAKLKRPYQT